MKKNELFKIITSFLFKNIFFIKFFIFICSLIFIITNKTKKKIGVVSIYYDNNVGNILLKFSMYIKLKELGFDPTIIALHTERKFYFLKKYFKFKVFKNNYLELKEKDYDINSDQTWNGDPKFFDEILNVGFLKFSENWKIPRFVYGASLGVDYWKFPEQFDIIARRLLKKFSGISLREIGAIEIVKNHLGINPEFVLDPTLIIDKKYYLDLIKDFNIHFNFKEKYLCIYQLDKNILIEQLIEKAKQLFNYKLYKIDLFKEKYIENFISCINNSNAVITDSFHGTLFSIIFEKPFITYLNTIRGNDRFFSLIKTFNLSQRIIDQENFEKVNINILQAPLYINQSLLSYLKNKSINFLKKNLNFTKY